MKQFSIYHLPFTIYRSIFNSLIDKLRNRKSMENGTWKMNDPQKGQILIVVILVLLVISLIVLASASRSITDIRISQTSEESARAFSAAEAGVEEAVERINTGAIPILTPAPIALPDNPNAGSYTVVAVGGVPRQAVISTSALVADVATFQVYLADRNNLNVGNYGDNLICLMWGNPGASAIPAIEASIVYQANVAPFTRVARFAIDPDDSGRRATNNFVDNLPAACPPTFIPATDNNLGVDWTFQYAHQLGPFDFILPGLANTCGTGSSRCVQLLRLRLLYNGDEAQYVGAVPFSASGTFPLQGYTITSTGTAGQSSRRVSVFRSFASLPSLFEFALYNHSGALVK